ncbi:hypothetical protein [Salinispora arenicola]|uniref:hypothetical protein n=1 Tax=Salinispora arenicola TaxID=168697 RepID=UPI00036911BE|nr:hypothetical protein [Salinispora arenicola]
MISPFRTDGAGSIPVARSTFSGPGQRHRRRSWAVLALYDLAHAVGVPVAVAVLSAFVGATQLWQKRMPEELKFFASDGTRDSADLVVDAARHG